MKTKAGNAKVTAKVAAKVAQKTKVIVKKVVPISKAVAKPIAKATKPAAKPVPKTKVKPAPKPASKPAPKTAPKTAPKPALKPAAKPAAKPPVKSGASVKPVGKPSSSKSAISKSVVKPSAKPPVVKKTETSAPKNAAKLGKLQSGNVKTKNEKPAPKAAAKNVTQVVEKNLKPEIKKISKTPVVAAKPSAPVPVAVVVQAAKPLASAPVPGVPVKAGRPSSRLAQLTVPSMAQSVASTAAKSSYTQTVVLPLIVPPLPSAAKKDPKLANNWKTKPIEQLSDAELIAMPDAEYMNEKQMAVFRLKLSILKQDILNSAGETTEHLREDTVVVPDPADRATIEEEHALELRTRDRERKLLKKIEQSIQRIDAGDYGYCDETGEPIGVGRLLARPTATLSLEAQQRRELKQKMFGD